MELKGIGVTQAAALIMFIGSFTYFNNTKQLTRHFRLSPTYMWSIISVNLKGHINCNGDLALKIPLYMVAFASLECNGERRSVSTVCGLITWKSSGREQLLINLSGWLLSWPSMKSHMYMDSYLLKYNPSFTFLHIYAKCC